MTSTAEQHGESGGQDLQERGKVRMAHWASWPKERARTSQESLTEALGMASGSPAAGTPSEAAVWAL